MVQDQINSMTVDSCVERAGPGIVCPKACES